MNEIIIRSSGERTERECIRRAEKQGNVHLIKARPFGAAIMETYILALELGAEFTAVIDADVLLYENVIAESFMRLKSRQKNVFCLDGRTDDKVFGIARRAGVHIYRTELLDLALNFIDDSALKPESKVREEMNRLGYPTWPGGVIVFGQHDYEQYYRDLWRKACCQAWKLKSMIDETGALERWKALATTDNDFKVISVANIYAREYLTPDMVTIDIDNDFGAVENIEYLGLIEKGEME